MERLRNNMGAFIPYFEVHATGDVTVYLRPDADYSRQLTPYIVVYLSLDTHEIVGCRVAVPELAENAKYRQAIRRVRDAWANGDDACWRDLVDLFQTLPEGFVLPEQNESVELDLCRQYIRSCHHPEVAYVSPQRRIEELEAEVARLRASNVSN